MKKTTTKRAATKRTTLKPPAPIELVYLYNPTTGCYDVSAKPTDFDRLPDSFYKERAISEKIKPFADHVIRSKKINGFRTFHSMLEKIPNYPDVFIVDDFYNSFYKNLILFFFANSDKLILVHYFKGFYPATIKGKEQAVKAYLTKFLG